MEADSRNTAENCILKTAENCILKASTVVIDNVELGVGRKTQGMCNVGSRKRTK